MEQRLEYIDIKYKNYIKYIDISKTLQNIPLN